jgi:hypothetical protein
MTAFEAQSLSQREVTQETISRFPGRTSGVRSFTLEGTIVHGGEINL